MRPCCSRDTTAQTTCSRASLPLYTLPPPCPNTPSQCPPLGCVGSCTSPPAALLGTVGLRLRISSNGQDVSSGLFSKEIEACPFPPPWPRTRPLYTTSLDDSDQSRLMTRINLAGLLFEYHAVRLLGASPSSGPILGGTAILIRFVICARTPWHTPFSDRPLSTLPYSVAPGCPSVDILYAASVWRVRARSPPSLTPILPPPTLRVRLSRQ